MTRILPALMMGSALMVAPAAMAQDTPAPMPMQLHAMAQAPALNLSASGEVRVEPDLATINFGVVTEAPTAAEAMRLNAERMTQVVAALRRAGINEREIQTSGLNLSAQYDYVQNEPPRLRGYQANNRVTVRILDLDDVGTTADAVVAAGVNQIDGISFGLVDPTEAENRARGEAVRALQSKAQLYAQALGVQLGGVRSLTEGGGYSPPPPMPMYAARDAIQVTGSRVTPVESGELTVRVDIAGVYDIVR